MVGHRADKNANPGDTATTKGILDDAVVQVRSRSLAATSSSANFTSPGPLQRGSVGRFFQSWVGSERRQRAQGPLLRGGKFLLQLVIGQ